MLVYLLAYLDDDDDKTLFADMFHSYSKQMYSLAESYLRNQDDAEDAVSTVFERIATCNFDLVRTLKGDDLRNYLLKATKNTALNMLGRTRGRALSLESISRGEREFLSDDGFVDLICDKMEYEDVLRAIEDLNEKYRDALYYHFVLEKTIPETASLLFQSVSATKQQLVRGKKALRN